MPVEVNGNPLTRRLLLQTSALAALVGVAPEAWGRPAGRFDVDVAIIGAGIAGLNTAYQLGKAGITDVAIYEADTRIGGRVQSLRNPDGTDLTVELGGEFIDSGHTDMLDLVQELQLTLFDFGEDSFDNPQIPQTGFLFGGVAYTEAELATRLQPLADQISNDAADVDADFCTFAPLIDALSVAEYLDGFAQSAPGGLDPVARALVEAGIRSEWGLRPDEASALTLLFNLPVVDGIAVQPTGNSDRRYGIVGGSSELVCALESAVGTDKIVLDHCVTSIVEGRRGYTVTFANGSSIRSRFVVVTIPFPQLRKITLCLRPSTLRLFEDALASYELGANEKLIVGYDSRPWRSSTGFIGDVYSDAVAVVWDSSRRQPTSQDAALTYFFGGSDAFDAYCGQDAEILADTLTAELDVLVPGLRQEQSGLVVLTDWANAPLVEGAYSTFRPGGFTDPSYLAWFIDPDDPDSNVELRKRGFVLAGEHLSTSFNGYMQGAAETGRFAAASIVDALARRHGSCP